MKVIISRLTPKVIQYRNYKKFDERNFLSDIQHEHFECKLSDLNENYEYFVQKLKIVNNHVSLKSKTFRARPAITCSNLTIEALEQGVKYVQS